MSILTHQSKKQINRSLQATLKYGLVIILLIVVLFPFYWMVATSLKPNSETYEKFRLWPKAPTIQHYVNLLNKTYFLVWLRNSITVAAFVTMASVILGTFAAYGLVRFSFPGRSLFSTIVLMAYLFPPTVLFIPLAVLVNRWGLSNSLYGLMLVYPTFAIPFCTWMLVGYFRSIPVELEEAALIDGCSRIGALFRVILPLSLPGIIAAAIFAFTLSWTEFLYVLVMNTSREYQTLTVGISEFVYADMYAWGKLMGASLLTTIPIIVLYTILQRYIVSGLTAGAIKA